MSIQPSSSFHSPSVPGFTLIERIGSGTFGVVYRACNIIQSQNGVKETVAIKCIDRKKMASKAAVNNLISEIAILKGARHKHIVAMFDFRYDDNYVYLIQEYCNAGDLSQFIKRQKCLPESVAQFFLRQLASAMQYLRENNVAHMDLKPHNILLQRVGIQKRIILKLADFGYARVFHPGDRERTPRGSPLYMAPEMFEADRAFDARVDLWSIGVILYECIFGRAPFASKTFEELMCQITDPEPDPIPIPESSHLHLSAECRELLSGLLQRKVWRRINFDDFFSHPFVDLEHAPSNYSLQKALSLFSRAEQAGSEDQASKSLKLYCRGLDYYLPAIQNTDDPVEKQQMRNNAKSIVAIAEKLKSQLGAAGGVKSVTSLPSEDSFTERDQLLSLWSDYPQVKAALTVISAAEELLVRSEFGEAKNKFQLATESMLNLIGQCQSTRNATEPIPMRETLLKKQVKKWLTKAEMIEADAELNLTMMVNKMEHLDDVEQNVNSFDQQNYCSMQ